jgi:hypothetical protein
MMFSAGVQKVLLTISPDPRHYVTGGNIPEEGGIMAKCMTKNCSTMARPDRLMCDMCDAVLKDRIEVKDTRSAKTEAPSDVLNHIGPSYGPDVPDNNDIAGFMLQTKTKTRKAMDYNPDIPSPAKRNQLRLEASIRQLREQLLQNKLLMASRNQEIAQLRLVMDRGDKLEHRNAIARERALGMLPQRKSRDVLNFIQ